MPKKKIPCADCAAETAELEDLGKTVLSCEPFDDDPDWCEISWKDRTRGAVNKFVPPTKSISRRKTTLRKDANPLKAKRAKTTKTRKVKRKR